MSFILLGILNSQVSGASREFTYWLSTIGTSSADEGWGLTVDSADNAYVLGQPRNATNGNRDFLLVKYDSTNAISWQRELGGSADEFGRSLGVDSSDNIYAFGRTSSEGEGQTDFLLAKYNSSGTIQWQRILGNGPDNLGESVAIDSSNNVYILGTSQGVMILAKYNSSGTIQWQKNFADDGGDHVAYSVAIDSSDNAYIFGWTDTSGAGLRDFALIKFNSSGSLQWQRTLGGSSQDMGQSVFIDSSDNIYVVGITMSVGAGGTDFLLAKYNSSGTIQWQRILGGSGNEWGYAVTADSVGNVYITGYTDSEGEGLTDTLIAKYNSSGTIQWQRVLGGSQFDRGYAIAVNSLDDLYVFGQTNSTGEGQNDMLLAKLPNDGSLTGTYDLDGVSMVYAASSLTAATASLTAATSSGSSGTNSFVAATSTLTSSDVSRTEHFVGIPE